MTKAKKSWTKPQLVVLGRGTPQERILEVCKNHDTPMGPGLTNCGWRGDPGNCQGVTGT